MRSVAPAGGGAPCFGGPLEFLVKNEKNRLGKKKKNFVLVLENNLENRENSRVEQSRRLHVAVDSENFSCRLTANDPAGTRWPPPYERFNFRTQCCFAVKLESGAFEGTSRHES